MAVLPASESESAHPGPTVPPMSELREGTPPGWYPDPNDPAINRYWNGHKWAGSNKATPDATELTEEQWRAAVLTELRAISPNTLIVALIYVLSIIAGIVLYIVAASGS